MRNFNFHRLGLVLASVGLSGLLLMCGNGGVTDITSTNEALLYENSFTQTIDSATVENWITKYSPTNSNPTPPQSSATSALSSASSDTIPVQSSASGVDITPNPADSAPTLPIEPSSPSATSAPTFSSSSLLVLNPSSSSTSVLSSSSAATPPVSSTPAASSSSRQPLNPSSSSQFVILNPSSTSVPTPISSSAAPLISSSSLPSSSAAPAPVSSSTTSPSSSSVVAPSSSSLPTPVSSSSVPAPSEDPVTCPDGMECTVLDFEYGGAEMTLPGSGIYQLNFSNPGNAYHQGSLICKTTASINGSTTVARITMDNHNTSDIIVTSNNTKWFDIPASVSSAYIHLYLAEGATCKQDW